MIQNLTTHNTLGSETPSANKKKKYKKPKKQNMGKFHKSVENRTNSSKVDGIPASGIGFTFS